MSGNSRTKKTLKNLIFQIIYEIFLVIAGIIFPRLIILKYGSDVNGLTSTINHLIQILNLIQAGAVGASIFQMFKPVAENDYETVGKVLNSSRKYFTKLGFIFFTAIVCITPLLLLLGNSSSITAFEKIVSFLILGLNSAFYFFFVSWFDILFSSFQKRYLLSIASIIDKVIYYFVLFIILQSNLPFYFMYFAILICTIIKVLVLFALYFRTYKRIIPKTKSNEIYKIPNKGYLLTNQLSTQSVDAIPSVAVSYIVGLSFASVFSIYILVQNMAKMIFTTLQQSVSEVFGNLVNSKDKDRYLKVYNYLEYTFFSVGLVLCGGISLLCLPFIYLYTNHNSFDVNYNYPIIALLIVLYCVFYCMYMPCFTLTNVLGYYKETYKQSVIFAIIALILSIGLCFIYWPLIAIGPALYYFLSYVYRNFVLKKRIQAFSAKKTIVRCLVMCIFSTTLFLFFYWFFNIDYWDSWIKWVLFGFLSVFGSVIFWAFYSFVFEREEMFYCFELIKKLFRRKA